LKISRLGGLLKKMPLTGTLFIIGSVAISGLPPLNGFISEFLIYFGAFQGGITGSFMAAIPGLILIVGLALIGGMAAAVFAKAGGLAFLGEPRSEQAVHCHEAGLEMTLPMVSLAACCILIGLFSPWIVMMMGPTLGVVTGADPKAIQGSLNLISDPLEKITVVAACLAGLVLAIVLLRKRLLRNREVSQAGTWDCGYLQPTASMQYTAASFVQPFMALFTSIVPVRSREVKPEGLFPQNASFDIETPDIFKERFYQPIFLGIVRCLDKLRWLQHGRIQLYILYIVVTLLVLFIWKL
jgi:hydrogenase-4 component B